MTTQRKIVLIDDNEIDRLLIGRGLENKGFQMYCLPSGEGCLELIAREGIELVLLDILLPGEDGRDILQSIRKVYSQLQLPIIMVTSKSDVSEVVHALQVGANDYISKPIDINVTDRRIRTQLQLVDLSTMMSRFKEMAAIDAMVATYNHEINNPLQIAMWCVQMLQEKVPSDEAFISLKEAVTRIASIVDKIENITNKSSLHYQQYLENSKTIKLD